MNKSSKIRTHNRRPGIVAEVVHFCTEFWLENGYGPSLVEVAEGCALGGAPNAVDIIAEAHHLGLLVVGKGYRTIRPLGWKTGLEGDDAI